MGERTEMVFFMQGIQKLPIVMELDDGKIYRKALYLTVKTMVSCRFSLKPIQWNSSHVLGVHGLRDDPTIWTFWGENCFTLWWTYKKLLKMAIEIVDFPIKNWWIFHCYVSSPEGKRFWENWNYHGEKTHQWTERGDWYPSLLSREKLWNWFAGWISLCKLHQRSIGVSRSQYREIDVESSSPGLYPP